MTILSAPDCSRGNNQFLILAIFPGVGLSINNRVTVPSIRPHVRFTTLALPNHNYWPLQNGLALSSSDQTILRLLLFTSRFILYPCTSTI